MYAHTLHAHTKLKKTSVNVWMRLLIPNVKPAFSGGRLISRLLQEHAAHWKRVDAVSQPSGKKKDSILNSKSAVTPEQELHPCGSASRPSPSASNPDDAAALHPFQPACASFPNSPLSWTVEMKSLKWLHFLYLYCLELQRSTWISSHSHTCIVSWRVTVILLYTPTSLQLLLPSRTLTSQCHPLESNP